MFTLSLLHLVSLISLIELSFFFLLYGKFCFVVLLFIEQKMSLINLVILLLFTPAKLGWYIFRAGVTQEVEKVVYSSEGWWFNPLLLLQSEYQIYLGQDTKPQVVL